MTRNADLKVIDFGQSAVLGSKKIWHDGDNIPPAPEARNTEAPATFAIDMWGCGYVLAFLIRAAVRGARRQHWSCRGAARQRGHPPGGGGRLCGLCDPEVSFRTLGRE